MPYEKAPSSGAFLPLSLMHILSGAPMHDLSGVDTKRDATSAPVSPGRPGGYKKPGDANLLSALRAWRTSIAKQRKVPAYVILHDATLEGIASARPKNHDQLCTVAGIGDKKLERYGDALLALVNSQSS